MKQISIATILLLSLWSLSGQITEVLSQNVSVKSLLLVQAQWQLFSFQRGKFAVKLPLEPKIFKDFTDIDGQQLDWLLFRADDDSYWNTTKNEDDPTSIYVVGYTDLDAAYIQQAEANFLEQLGNSLFQEFELEELNPQGKSISLNGQRGLEFSGNAGDSVAAMRLYLVERRLYVLYVVSEKITNIDHFFNSFQLQSAIKN